MRGVDRSDMMERMADERALPPLVGRVFELQTLLQAAGVVDGQGSGPVIVGGDAGIGKTRLLREAGILAKASGQWVMVGHCLDLGDSALPLQPFVEAFASLPESQRTILAQELPALQPLLWRDVAELADRAELFAAVAAGLDLLAADRPVLLIVEDAHWADPSTRRLLRFVLGYVFTHDVHIVVSYRADDLHRRHPLREALAEWVRLSDVRRIELEPLGDVDLADLVNGRAGRQLDVKALRAIVGRAAGNAFFAEELLDAGLADMGARLPDTLADLLLVRLDQLDATARSVVKVIACAAGPVGHRTLETVADLSADEVADGVRAALDHRVLALRGERYTFRHALLAEAVHDDLLPAERRRLHAAYLEAIGDGRLEPRAAALVAHHALGAGDLTQAFRSSVDAGHEAVRLAGHEEAARHFEQALALVDHAPDDADLVTLVIAAADATMASGHPVRATALLRDQLVAGHDLAVDDRVRLLVAVSETAYLGNDDAFADEVSTQAVELVGPDERPLRAQALAKRSLVLLSIGRDEEAVTVGEQALAIAERLDMPDVTADVNTTLMRAAARTGTADLDKARRRYLELIERSRAAGDVVGELRGHHNLGFVLMSAGLLTDAEDSFTAAMNTAARNGRAWAPYGFDGRVFAAFAAVLRGAWSNAEVLLHHGPEAPRLASAMLDATQSLIRAARGDLTALDDAARMQAFWERDMAQLSHSTASQIELYGIAGDHVAAEDVHDRSAIVLDEHWKSPLSMMRIRHTALLLDAWTRCVESMDRGETARVVARAGEVEAALDDVIGHWGNVGPEARAWRLRAAAELLRLRAAAAIDAPSREDAVAAWRADVEAFTGLAQPYELARSRARLAAALGAGPEAAALLAQAQQTAERLGAQPLIDEIGSQNQTRATTPASGLTSRELEVLAQVALGRSNGEIAKTLFISTKTVSVHVSNILAKLQASSRTEAAAIAHRDGLLT